MTLPDDLERLGRQLELAAGGAVRRRVRRQRIVAGLAVLAATAPLALALANDGDAGLPAASRSAVAADLDVSFAAASQDNVAVRQARARPVPEPPEPACLDSNHCGRAAPPMRFVSYPDPARRA